jgi:tRNA threonylcarbamoyladenosine modification (KEOPS) complex Cgi121 subunit
MKLITELTVDDAFDVGVQEGKKQALRELLEFSDQDTFVGKLIRAKLKEQETKLTIERTLRNEETDSIPKA